MNNQWFSKVAVWLVIALVLFTVFKQFDSRASASGMVGYSDFLEQVRNNQIKSAIIQEGRAVQKFWPSPLMTAKSARQRLISIAAWLAI